MPMMICSMPCGKGGLIGVFSTRCVLLVGMGLGRPGRASSAVGRRNLCSGTLRRNMRHLLRQISGCSGSGKEQVTQCAIGLADGDEIRVQPVIALRIIETATVEPQYLAASAFQYGLCRSRIPLAGGGKARIQISPALGQNAELQGAADSRQLDVMPALEPVQ